MSLDVFILLERSRTDIAIPMETGTGNFSVDYGKTARELKLFFSVVLISCPSVLR